MNQLQQDLQNELMIANRLLKLISVELQQILCLTNPGGDLEKNIIQNANLINTLANIQRVDLEKLPPFTRRHINISMHTDQNASYEQHNTFRNDSEMDESQ